MRHSYLFWGSALILLSGLFLLKATGILQDDVLGYFWPLLLLLIGVWVLASAFLPRDTFVEEGEAFAIDLQGASEAKVEFNHGAGQIEIRAGAPSGQLMTGTKALGMDVSSKLVGGILEAEVNAGPTFVPFIGPSGGAWRFDLNRDIPLTLEVSAGASNVSLDLSDLLVKYLSLETGASSVRLTLPSRAESTFVEIEAGAANLEISVPEGVVARIRIKEGMTALNIDRARFPNLERGIYQSANYHQAAHRAELNIEAGAASVNIQ